MYFSMLLFNVSLTCKSRNLTYFFCILTRKKKRKAFVLLLKSVAITKLTLACADPESFVRGAPILTTFFVFSFPFFQFKKGEWIQYTIRAGHHRPTSETP